jgi:uncharacterized coiled-coil protein SlyX
MFKDLADAESRYKNMQSSTGEKINALQSLVGSQESQIADLNKTLEGLRVETQTAQRNLDSANTAAEQEKATLAKQIEALTGEKTTLEKNLTRTNLLLKKFPNLAPWEERGLLPDGDGMTPEQMEDSFKGFAELLGVQSLEAEKRLLEGGKPPGTEPEAPKQPLKESELYDAAMIALKEKKLPEYNRLMDQLASLPQS